MVEDERTDEILKTIKKIQESRQPVKKYFENNFVPFSRSQYYIYCKTLQKHGEEGLYDHREEGNNTKLTQRIKDFIVTTVKENRSVSSSKLKDKIASTFGVNLSESSINIFRSSESLTRIPTNKPEYQHEKSGGCEILTFLSFYTGIIEIITKTIIQRLDEVHKSIAIDNSKIFKPDHSELRDHG